MGRLRAMLMLVAATGTVPVVGEVVFDGSLGAPGTLEGAMTVAAEQGQLRGANLFHSFSTFNVRAGESVMFDGPTGVERVFNRVTGSAPSVIDGRIATTMAAADFYFMNPHGVMFGADADIDLPAAFHVTTADEIRFPDAVFEARAGNVSLSVAAPEAFGFTRPAPAPIDFAGSLVSVARGARLGVVGGDITLDDASLVAQEGDIDLVSAASTGRFSLADRSLDAARQGRIELRPLQTLRVVNGLLVANVDVSGDRAGTIHVRGGELVADFGFLFADTYGQGAGGGIDLELAGDLLLDNGARITADTVAGSAGQGGDVQLSLGGTLSLRERARIATDAKGGADGGNVQVHAGAIDLASLAAIATNATSTGQAGDVSVQADTLLLAGGGRVTVSSAGAGASGSVDIVLADALHATGLDETAQTPSGIFANALSAGDAGNIRIVAPRVTVTGGAAIAAETTAFATGAPGTVSIEAGEVVVSGQGRVDASTAGAARGGDLRLEADTLMLSDGGQVSVASTGAGASGSVEILLNATLQATGARGTTQPAPGIFASAQGAGDAGDIRIVAPQVMLDGAAVAADTGLLATRAPGTVMVESNNLVLTGAGRIDTSTAGAAGGGDIRIVGGRLVVNEGASIGASTGVNSTGTGGSVDVLVDRVELDSGGAIDSSTAGTGAGGDITVQGRVVTLMDGATVSSSATGAGFAGTVNVLAAERIELAGSASVETSSARSGGGDIRVEAVQWLLLDNATISASARGTEAVHRGGNVFIDPEFVILRNSAITAQAVGGDGGTINLIAENFIRDPNSVLDATSQEGNDGEVRIETPEDNISASVSTLVAEPDATPPPLVQPCFADAMKNRSTLRMARSAAEDVSPERYASILSHAAGRRSAVLSGGCAPRVP